MSQIQQQLQYQQHPGGGQSNGPTDHQLFQWNYPYRECGLYNKALKSQIDRENKIFNRDFSRGPNKKKFVNLFAGFDNSQPMPFDDLKKQTFKDIFSCGNKEASSIKRPLNYLNYTKLDHDIISKQRRNPAFQEYQDNIQVYDSIRPPPFDLELNQKQAKKRQNATLDKQSKKYIIKNIRTCSQFAKTQRDKSSIATHHSQQIDLKLRNRQSLLRTSQAEYLDSSLLETNVTPANLRQRRLQILHRNRNRREGNYSTIITGGGRRLADGNHEARESSLSPEQDPPLGFHQRTKSVNIEQQLPQGKKQNGNLVYFRRKPKSVVGTMRFNENEAATLDYPRGGEGTSVDLDDLRNHGRFRQQRNYQRQTQRFNPEPMQALQPQADYNTIQHDSLKLPLDFKRKTVDLERESQAEQMKRRSLSSHCKKRPLDAAKRKLSADQQSNVTIQSLTEKASQAYKEDDPNANKRIQNLEKFMKLSQQKGRGEQDGALNYAMSYLDKLEKLNTDKVTHQGNDRTAVMLNNYQWNKDGSNPLQIQDQEHLFQDEEASKEFDLNDEEKLIDAVLFERRKKHKKDLYIPIVTVDQQGLETQQGTNSLDHHPGGTGVVQKLSTLESELCEERKQRKELEAALDRLSIKIKELSKQKQGSVKPQAKPNR